MDRTPAEVRQQILNVLHDLVAPRATPVRPGDPLPTPIPPLEVERMLCCMEMSARIANLCDPGTGYQAGSPPRT